VVRCLCLDPEALQRCYYVLKECVIPLRDQVKVALSVRYLPGSLSPKYVKLRFRSYEEPEALLLRPLDSPLEDVTGIPGEGFTIGGIYVAD